MGLLQNGQWVDQWYDTDASKGEFVRSTSGFRNWVTANGTAGPTGKAGFNAEKGRYHLYVSLACPWAHRTLIFLELKNLKEYIDVTVVEPVMLENGWELDEPLYGFSSLYQLYLKADPTYEGRVTVPVLWDKKTNTIVSNESSEIIRMFNSAFDGLVDSHEDYYPESLRAGIDDLNDRIYRTINNGVYQAGFATSQKAYESALQALFDSLDWVERILNSRQYLAGNQITESDWRLFTTLIRFDAVYVGHFKCNLHNLTHFPAISAYIRELYQIAGVAQTVNFDHIKTHYYRSHTTINPNGIVPAGPEQNFLAPYHPG